MRYAAYGSNLHPRRLAERVDVTLIGKARVDGWRLDFHKRSIDQSGKCTISLAASEAIWVAVYEMGNAELSKLDRIEGLGNGYAHADLHVPDFGVCTTYVATHLDAGLSPYDWYKRLVIAGCHFHGFPASYVESIVSIESKNDPDPTRAKVHEDLLVRL